MLVNTKIKKHKTIMKRHRVNGELVKLKFDVLSNQMLAPISKKKFHVSIRTRSLISS